MEYSVHAYKELLQVEKNLIYMGDTNVWLHSKTQSSNQRAKKVVSDSPGLVNFVQVKFFEESKSHE